MCKERHDRGFTLAELLIVVAIIGVLVAISIPIFSSQLEKARDAATVANIRNAYAEAQALAITGTNGEAVGNATYKELSDHEFVIIVSDYSGSVFKTKI